MHAPRDLKDKNLPTQLGEEPKFIFLDMIFSSKEPDSVNVPFFEINPISISKYVSENTAGIGISHILSVLLNFE